MARRAPPPRDGGHLGGHPEPLRRGGGPAPDLRRTVEIRHRGHADRHGLPGPAQRAGAARRQVAERKAFHAPSAGPRPRRGPRAADRRHEPRKIHRRRGRGVPPLEILDRRGGLSRGARRGARHHLGHRPPARQGRRRGGICHHADVLRQCQILRLRAPLPRSGDHRADHPGIKPLSTLRHLEILPKRSA